MLDEPPPPRPTPSTITYIPEKEPLTEKAAGDACTPANSVTATPDAWKDLSSGQTWVQVMLENNHTYQIYVDMAEEGNATIKFVCDPTPEEIANTRARPGTGLSPQDASLTFVTTAAGLHYVKITTSSGGKRVLVADRTELEPIVPVGGTAIGSIQTPTDTDGVELFSLMKGKSYQIDVRSDGHPSIDPWIKDIYAPNGDRITRTGRCDYTNTPPDPPACTTFFGASYDGFFDHDSGPGNAARVIYTATETGNHLIEFGSRGAPSQRLGDWHLEVTEASAPFFDDFAADASTTGTVSVGGSVSGWIDSTPSWYNAGDTGGPSGYSSHEPGYADSQDFKPPSPPPPRFSCHREAGDGIALDGDTCDRDWFRVELTNSRTYKLQLESGTDLLIDGVYRFGSLYQKGGTTYTARSNGIHYISVAGTNGCIGLHGCTGSYTLTVTEE